MKQLVILMMLVLVIGTGGVLASEPIGTVEQIEGTATAQGEDGTLRELGQGSPVFLADDVKTGANSKLQIRFVDDTVINQAEKSQFIINEYVFSGKKSGENGAFLRMFQGAFKVVTDKITKLNPDRFKVKTNYGTIGIRGCELGFDLGNDENVMIVGLHHADSVVVNMDDAPKGRASATTVTEDGVLVNLSELDGLTQRELRLEELLELNRATTPAISASSEEDALGGAEEAAAPADAAQGLASDTAANVPFALADEAADAVAKVEVVEEEQDMTDSAPSSASSPSFPQVGPRTTLASGSGSGWSWDAWAQERVDLVGGQQVSSFDVGSSASGAFISAPAFDAIASGGTLYNLTGAGSAGAAVAQGNQVSGMSGTASMNVRVGLGILPSWSGSYNMSGGGNALSFNANGGISGGALSGDVTSYNLNAFGNSYGAPASRNISGGLTGSGAGPDPISGAVVNFDFDHGPGGPRVSGGGGASF